METGQRKDLNGALVPAHFITEVSAEHSSRQVLAAQFSTAVSKGRLKFKGGAKGDKVIVSWTDNQGRQADRRGQIALTRPAAGHCPPRAT